jgi:hypothetical protein
MAHRKISISLAAALCLGPSFLLSGSEARILAQSPPTTTSAARQLGTVKSVSGNTLTLATDSGQTITVTISADAKVLKLPPGSTDLKAAQPGQVGDVSVGDRALATGKPGETPDTLTASRVILMKSADIAEKIAAEQAQWRTNGTSGIVSAVDPATGTITVTVGANKVTVTTTGKTSFKRFSGDSVKYQDAKPGAIGQIHTGDQLQARGEKSADGSSVQADEVVSGSFKNLSGLVINSDPAAGTITLKDLATKKLMTVNVTPNTTIRKMPPQMAQMMAGRAQGGGQGAGRAGAGGGNQGGGVRGGNGGSTASGGGEGAGAPGAAGGQGGMRRSGGDLSQMLNRLPPETLADLNKGEAVMIVASEPTPGATTVTAVTLLTGVEPILTANPNGGMDLSGWTMGQAPGGGAE